MVVDISTPFLRHCFPVVYSASYCNGSNYDIDSVELTITLPPEMLLENTGMSYTSLGGNQFLFDLGIVPLGATKCVQASISPNNCLTESSIWSTGWRALPFYWLSGSHWFLWSKWKTSLSDGAFWRKLYQGKSVAWVSSAFSKHGYWHRFYHPTGRSFEWLFRSWLRSNGCFQSPLSNRTKRRWLVNFPFRKHPSSR